MIVNQSFYCVVQLFLFTNLVTAGLPRRSKIAYRQKKAMCCGNNWKDAKNGNWSNNFERNKQIYSRSSYKHIQIHGRKVDGKGEDGAEYAKLTIESNYYGQVKIKGMKSGYYLCVSKTGRLVGRRKRPGKKMRRCIYKREYSSKGYVIYKSRWRPKWYLAFKRNGTPKLAKGVSPRSRAAQFLVRPLRQSRREQWYDRERRRMRKRKRQQLRQL